MKLFDRRGPVHRRDQGTEGFTNHLLLALIHQEPGYGFELIRRLGQAGLPGGEGSILPRLHALENDGLLDSYRVYFPDGRMRKYYQIMASGQQTLVQWTRQWRTFRSAMDSLVDGPQHEGGGYV